MGSAAVVTGGGFRGGGFSGGGYRGGYSASGFHGGYSERLPRWLRRRYELWKSGELPKA